MAELEDGWVEIDGLSADERNDLEEELWHGAKLVFEPGVSGAYHQPTDHVAIAILAAEHVILALLSYLRRNPRKAKSPTRISIKGKIKGRGEVSLSIEVPGGDQNREWVADLTNEMAKALGIDAAKLKEKAGDKPV